MNQLRKPDIAVAPSLKAKRAKQKKRGTRKITSSGSLYSSLEYIPVIYNASNPNELGLKASAGDPLQI